MEFSFKIGSSTDRPRFTWKTILSIVAVLALLTAMTTTVVFAVIGDTNATDAAGATLFFTAVIVIPAWAAHRIGRRDPAAVDPRLEARLDQQDEKLDLILDQLHTGRGGTIPFPRRDRENG